MMFFPSKKLRLMAGNARGPVPLFLFFSQPLRRNSGSETNGLDMLMQMRPQGFMDSFFSFHLKFQTFFAWGFPKKSTFRPQVFLAKITSQKHTHFYKYKL